MREIATKNTGDIVNWTGLARKYSLKLNNKFPYNGGQVLYEYAKSKGIKVFQFNPHTRVSGRDYNRRVRRSLKRIFKSNITVPTPRSSKKSGRR